MEYSPKIELTPRKVDIKPAFHLTTPQVSKEMAVCFLDINNTEISDPMAKGLLDRQRMRIENIFDEAGNGDSDGLREKMFSFINNRLNGSDISMDDKRDLLSDRNFLNSLFNKVDSWRDSLTGLYNRRGLNEMMKMVSENPAVVFGDNYKEITGKGFSLMMMDIDFFKNINDKLGHEEGDRALMEFSRSIGESVRSTDVVVRFGGEEVLIIALGTDPGDAVVVDAKIAGRVGKIELGRNGEGVHFTYSMGVDNQKTWEDLTKTVISKDPMALSLLLHDADTALHEAKDTGRNKIMFAEN